MHVLLAVACFFAVLIFFVVILIVRDRTRSNSLERQARLLGLSFEEVSKPLEGATLGQIPPLLENGPSTVGFNVLTGTVRGLQVRVFDLRDEAAESPFWTTVAGFHLESAALPTFEISVNTRREGIGKVPNPSPAAVNDQEFGPEYSVRCAMDRKRAYEFLTPTRLEALRLHLGSCHLACSSEWIFVYRLGFKVQPSDLARYLDGTWEIAHALLQEAPAGDRDQKSEAGRGGTKYSHAAGAGD